MPAPRARAGCAAARLPRLRRPNRRPRAADNPAQPWTVASLAQATNVSRAALARRFNELVGQPPMAFLTGWRLDLAADLLCESDAPISTVAEQVGYGSPFALSTAFKRVTGLSPQQHRARTRASDHLVA